MAWLERMRAAQFAGITALALLAVGCSEDPADTKPRGNNSDNDEDGDGDDEDKGGEQLDGVDDTDDTDGDKMDSGKPPIDSGKPPAVLPDAGDAGAVVLPTDKDGGKPGKSDSAIPNIGATPLTPLPHDGEKVSICYSDFDCMGDDLTCYLPGGIIPGVCVDDCAADTDCPALDGVKGSCDILAGQCVYGCDKGGKPEGKCPEDMVCTNHGNPLFLPNRCRYPEGGGKKTEEVWAKCEPLHLGGDCEGLAMCWQPRLNASSLVLPHGYCSPLCTRDADCDVPEDATNTKGTCSLGLCELDCAAPGARCPVGMNCRDIDTSIASIVNRCVYID